MAEGTSARLDTVDVADNSGWTIESTHQADLFTRGDTVIEVRYSTSDVIESAVKHGTKGESEAIDQETARKVDLLRSWLTGGGQPVAAEVVTAGDPVTSQSQLYWEFWRQFRDRVATEHPDWKARAGTSRTSPNATLPAGTPRTIFCSAFKPGPLRFELAFVHPDPAINIARFEALRAKKEQFERALGYSLVWYEMKGKNDTRVYIESPFRSIDARDRWPAMMDWLIEQHVRFRQAIQVVGGLDDGPTITRNR